jgi:uncharacterized PurR-regulated membrane protein YhhQ (DUF165 family)
MYVLIYLFSIVLANFVVLWFGPKSTIINAFLLIGMDLTLRDKLHDRWHNDRLWLKMFLLIFSGSMITYFLNRSALQIASASVVAFSFATITDTIIYSFLIKQKFLVKANGSNLGSALVDSVLFPTIAFGMFMPLIILGQFLAKVFGGFVWSVMLNRVRSKRK